MAMSGDVFPLDISSGSIGGPEFNTTVLRLNSGAENRNANWEDAKHRFNIRYGIKTEQQLQTVLAFFLAHNGPLDSFLYRDRGDYKSVRPDQSTSGVDITLSPVGDGTEKTWQLVKPYSSGSVQYTRDITRPENGTISVTFDDVVKTEGVDWTLDYTTGVLTATPGVGVTVKWGGHFYVPCRFANNHLPRVLDSIVSGSIADIPLVEVPPGSE